MEKEEASNRASRDHTSCSSCRWWLIFARVLLAAHLTTALLLLHCRLPDQGVLGPVCLFLTILFVSIRHRSARLFSIAPTLAGCVNAAREVADLCQLQEFALTRGAAASHRGIALLAEIQSRALVHAVVLVCLGAVQAVNLALHLKALRAKTLADDLECQSKPLAGGDKI
ncbi:LAME_0F17458g1_1 [Lachancea meyersii CBS 8951]|uniref:LAME_0F17458g1_1 n=1 Tax=Lachancea meyersii CBS 8951 TaxID=1266667 RepID=A0A1G4JZX8_9SACH|nr:LAME_0F17458g1_1 [Lachancea meyersii CBS 8951]